MCHVLTFECNSKARRLSKLSRSDLVANSDYLLHVTPTAMFNAGIGKNLAIIVITVQSTSHLTEPTRLGKRPQGVANGPGGCLNASVVGRPQKWY